MIIVLKACPAPNQIIMRLNFTNNSFLFVLFFTLFIGLKVNAQCAITTSRNTTGLTCGTSPLTVCNGVVTIGDGINAMVLTMTSNVDLSCLGPIRFVVKKYANVDFSTGNYNLQLADGSSIEVETGGQIGAPTNCSASDLIKIGDVKVASCTGQSALTNFPDLVSNGGYSSITATADNSSICTSGSTTLRASASPSTGVTFKWYNAQTGGTLLSTGANYTIPTISTTTTYYVEGVYSGYTTVRKAVTVTIVNLSQPTLGTVTQPTCSVATGSFSISNYNASYSYAVSPSTGVIVSGSTITAPAGTYTVTATLGSCTSTASASVTVNAQPATPVQPTLGTVTQPTCSVAKGSFAISNFDAAYTYSVSPATGVTFSGSTVVAPAGTYTVTAILGSCSSVASASVTVNPQPATPLQPTLGTVVQPGCSVATGSFTITNYNASYTYTVSPSTGVSRTGANVTAPAGNYTVTATLGSCVSVASASVSVTAQPSIPSTPSAGTPTNPTCTVPTGSVTLSGLPATGTIIQTGTKSETYTISGSGSQIISSLLPGTYYFSASNGTCESSIVQVDIVTPETNTWSNGSWSKGTPTINQRLVFASDYTNANDVDLVGCSCQVTGTSAVTIKSGRTMKIENGIEVMPNASLTFENNASLVQINNAAVNSGNINYRRYTAAVKRYDFTYWSSPVAGQTLKNLSPNTLYDKYYSYNNGWQIIYNGAATMVAGKGYLVRAPQTFSIAVAAVDTNPIFIGTPNNGVVSFSVAGNQVHLLGNPYPSAIDANAFLDANAATLEGTLYFWTHNSAPSSAVAGDATYNYTTSDYLIYNRVGGVVTNNTSKPFDGKIAAGQGFFAPASTAGGTLIFNNSMRVEGGASGANNSQFFKLSSTTKTSVSTVEKSRIWLNLSNKQGAFKQMLVGYIKGATNDYDSGYDGVTYDGNQYVDFYSVNQASKYVIQGRALPFVKQDTVVLGYKSTIVGEFQIGIDHADGVLETQNVFLEDKTLNVLHNLKNGSYTFTTEKGVFNDRFVLRYVDKNAVEEIAETPTPNDGVSNSGNEISSSIVIYSKDKLITVKSPEVDVQKIVVYDSTGKLLYANENVAVAQFTFTEQLASDQVLLVDVLLTNGTKVSRKVIY